MEQENLSIKYQLMQLYKLSFDDCQDYIDYFFSFKTSIDKTVYLMQDKRIVSALHLVDKTVKIRGTDIYCPYIVAASTLQELRGNKLMERVMFNTFDKLYAEGTSITALYPVSRTYYLKYGFINSTFIDKLTICNIDNNAKTVTATAELMKSIYDKHIIKYNLYTLRTLNDFRNYLLEWASGGAAVEIYSYNKNKIWVAFKDNEIEEVFGDISVLSRVTKFNNIQVDVEGDTQAFVQSRIINPIKLLNEINYDNDGQMCFNIIDSFYPINNCTVNLNVTNGKGSCIKIDKPSDINIDISLLSKAICGVNEDYGIFSQVLKPKYNFCLDKY